MLTSASVDESEETGVHSAQRSSPGASSIGSSAAEPSCALDGARSCAADAQKIKPEDSSHLDAERNPSASECGNPGAVDVSGERNRAADGLKVEPEDASHRDADRKPGASECGNLGAVVISGERSSPADVLKIEPPEEASHRDAEKKPSASECCNTGSVDIGGERNIAANGLKVESGNACFSDAEKKYSANECGNPGPVVVFSVRTDLVPSEGSSPLAGGKLAVETAVVDAPAVRGREISGVGHDCELGGEQSGPADAVNVVSEDGCGRVTEKKPGSSECGNVEAVHAQANLVPSDGSSHFADGKVAVEHAAVDTAPAVRDSKVANAKEEGIAELDVERERLSPPDGNQLSPCRKDEEVLEACGSFGECKALDRSRADSDFSFDADGSESSDSDTEAGTGLKAIKESFEGLASASLEPVGGRVRRTSMRAAKVLHSPIIDDTSGSEDDAMDALDMERPGLQPDFELDVPDFEHDSKSGSSVVGDPATVETSDGKKRLYVRPTIDEYEEGFWRTFACGVNGMPIDLCYGVDVEAEGAFDSTTASYAEGNGSTGSDVPRTRLPTHLSLADECKEASLEQPGACSDSKPTQADDSNVKEAPGLPRWHPGNINSAGVLRHLPRMPGINTPMFYVGQLFTRFCWHVEDGFLNSVSFLHSGSAEKIWYVIPPDYSDEFETYAAQEVFAPCLQKDGKGGRALLGNKTTLFDPRDVAKRGIPVYRAVHTAGSFVFTSPRAYHGGFNTGCSVAEAVNFAQSSWFPLGRLAAVNMRARMQPMPIPLEFILFREAVDLVDCLEKRQKISLTDASASTSQQLASDARVIASELSRIIEHGEAAIKSFTSVNGCRLIDNACFATPGADDAPTLAACAGRPEESPKKRQAKAGGLVTARHSAQLDPAFGKSAGMSCAICKNATYFYVAVCGTCTDGFGDARCPLHFMDGGPICDLPGHTPLIIRRHSPVVLLDLLRSCEEAAEITVDDATMLLRFTGYVRPWNVDPALEGTSSLLKRLPMPEDLRISKQRRGPGRGPGRGRGRGRGRAPKPAMDGTPTKGGVKKSQNAVRAGEPSLLKKGPFLPAPLGEFDDMVLSKVRRTLYDGKAEAKRDRSEGEDETSPKSKKRRKTETPAAADPLEAPTTVTPPTTTAEATNVPPTTSEATAVPPATTEATMVPPTTHDDLPADAPVES